MRARATNLLMCLALGACVSAGTKVTAEDTADFVSGRTTEADVVDRLGQPNSSTTESDGTKIDVYVYTEAHATAATYVPVVGLFAGGARGTGTTATFTFDASGLLKAKSTGQSNSQVNAGLLNQ